MWKSIVALIASGVLAGCASMPDVTVKYFYPKAQTQLQVTQSLACNAGKTGILAVATVTATTAYSSDRGQDQGSLRYKDLSGTFADADVTVSLTDDGRLAGINATSTGQGDAFLKNIITFATTVAPLAIPIKALEEKTKAQKVQDTCDVINSYGGGSGGGGGGGGGGGKPVTLTYNVTLPYDPADPQKPDDFTKLFSIDPDPGSSALYTQLHDIFPKLAFAVQVTKSSAPDTAVYSDQTCKPSDAVVLLWLNKFAIAKLIVNGPDASLEKDATLWTSEIPVPLRSKSSQYCLPIPKAAFFGKQSFGLALSGYGSIQKLQYAKNTGAADATDAATALAKALKGPSAADQAAIVKGEADLIAQQQRLVVCQANPVNCK